MIDQQSPPRERLRRPQPSEGATLTATAPPRKPLRLKPGLDARALAKALSRPLEELLAELAALGASKSASDPLDAAEIELLAASSGRSVLLPSAPAPAAQIGDLRPRPPVVAVLGHVDHGKTTLLDALRRSRVAAGEEGGITQSLGAYALEREIDGERRSLTFLDTPGHEAFAALRARGAQAADLAVLVVAADDGVRPQTLESLAEIRAAAIPVVVALSKVDRPQADPERVLSELAKAGLAPEQWGGDVQIVPVAAPRGKGLEELLERLLLVADLELDLRASASAPAAGVVLESRLDRRRGPLATVLLREGTLAPGQLLVAGAAKGRVRALRGEQGLLAAATPGQVVELQGLDAPPQAGTPFQAAGSEREARRLATPARAGERPRPEARLFDEGSEPVELKLLLKASEHGLLEAALGSLARLSHPELRLSVVSSGLGPLSESDVDRAQATGAEVVCFQADCPPEARRRAQAAKVAVSEPRLIHELVGGVEARLVALLPAVEVEDELAELEVVQTFRSSRVGTIAGCRVLRGEVRKGARARLERSGELVADSAIGSLQRSQKAVASVPAGQECGLYLEGADDVRVGDLLQVYVRREARRSSLSEPRPAGRALA